MIKITNNLGEEFNIIKFSEILSSFEKFFNDIVGSIIPGLFLLFGLSQLGFFEKLPLQKEEAFSAETLFLLIAASYITGHLLSEIYRQRLSLARDREARAPYQDTGGIEKRGEEEGEAGESNDRMDSSSVAIKSNSLLIFRNWLETQIADWRDHPETRSPDEASEIPRDGPQKIDLHWSELRSIAMTLSEEAKFLSRRFKFIELLCAGVSNALWGLALAGLGKMAFQYFNNESMSVMFLALAAAEIAAARILYQRAKRFGRLSNKVCFDCAVADVVQKNIKGGSS